MKINYCLPILKTTCDEVLQQIETNKKDYQYFEIWLDYITDLNEEFINELLELFSNKLIFVLRRINFEKNRLNIKNRLVILSILKNAKVIVDLDIKANKKELDYLKIDKGKISTIISYHNYRYTPNDKTLMDVIETIKKYHSKIIKIATFCKNEKDALRLLQIQQALIKKKKTVIILGMGKFGTITRVFGTLWGNAMIFAPKTVNEATAKGQLTKTQLENIFNELNKFEIIN